MTLQPTSPRDGRATAITNHPGLAEAARLATELPEPSLTDLLNSVDDWHRPAYAGSEILPGLFQGGTEDDDVVSRPGNTFLLRGTYPYDVVVTLYASAQPAPWGVEELRFGFLDTALDGSDVERVIRAARFAYQRWTGGDTVLVRCQAGMNRSGLVTALVLVMAGLTPAQAVTLIRARRSAGALFNEHFVIWLHEHGQDAVAAARAASPSLPRAA